MVGLNPAKFYGRLLPRPRIYSDVKFNDSRVDPPEPVNAKLLQWASEASWKMGGTAVKRKRMSGKIEGRMNKLRNMEESDKDDEAPPPKKVRGKLSFRKKKREGKESTPSVLEKQRTPIERVLESPGNAKVSKRGKLAPRRIVSGDDTPNQAPVVISRARRSRKEQPIPESEDDSDDDVEGFMLRMQSDKLTPDRSIRRSTRLQASPTPSLTPNSKRPVKTAPGSGDGRSSPRSPLSFKHKRIVEDSGSESDESDDEQSESVFL